MKKNKKNSILKQLVLVLVLFLFILGLSNIRESKTTHLKSITESTNKSMTSKAPSVTPTPSIVNQNHGVAVSSAEAATKNQKPLGYCLRVPVLVYHHIQPQVDAVRLKQTSLSVDNRVFDQQMGYLASHGYTSISALDLVNALRTHTGLPPKSVVVSMDDGYADNAIYALPILKKYNIRANLMLATGLVGSNPNMLTLSQVQDMKNSGLYYFANHTWSHYPITRGPQSKIEMEIDTAAGQIKQYLGQDVNIFTYPYGSFNNNAIQTLRRKGYIGGFSTISGFYQCDSFIMTLHRIHIGNSPLSSYGL